MCRSLDEFRYNRLGFNLCFQNADSEALFAQSLEEELLQAARKIAGIGIVVVQAVLMLSCNASYSWSSAEHQMWTVCIWLLAITVLVLLTCLSSLKHHTRFTRVLSCEYVVTGCIAVIAVLMNLGCTWHLPLLERLHAAPRSNDPSGVGPLLMLAQGCCIASVCSLCPVRSCILWCVPVLSIVSYVAVNLLIGSPSLETATMWVLLLGILSFSSYDSARRHERSRRDDWIHAHDVKLLQAKGGQLDAARESVLVNAMCNVAGAFCDAVVRLSDDFRICGSSDSQSNFFGREMNGVLLSEILAECDRDTFNVLVERAREVATDRRIPPGIPSILKIRSGEIKVNLFLAFTDCAATRFLLFIQTEGVDRQNVSKSGRVLPAAQDDRNWLTRRGCPSRLRGVVGRVADAAPEPPPCQHVAWEILRVMRGVDAFLCAEEELKIISASMQAVKHWGSDVLGAHASLHSLLHDDADGPLLDEMISAASTPTPWGATASASTSSLASVQRLGSFKLRCKSGAPFETALTYARLPQGALLIISEPLENKVPTCGGSTGAKDWIRPEYTRLRLVGHGGQASVYQVKRSDGQVFALKEINLEKPGMLRTDQAKQLRDLDRELLALRRLSWARRWIVHLEEHWLTQSVPKTAIIIMEFLPLSLKNWSDARYMGGANVEKPGLWQLEVWLVQISVALKIVHQINFIHRDVKPSNILLTNATGGVKLADFGVARRSVVDREIESGTGTQLSESSTAALTLVVGSHGYMAPEVLSKQGLAMKPELYGPPCDIFSLGRVAQELLPYFEGAETSEIRQLINLMTEEDPSSRPTVDEILAHPTFATHASLELRLLDTARGLAEDAAEVGGEQLVFSAKFSVEPEVPAAAMLHVDPRGRVTMWSNALVELLGRQAQEVVGKSLMEMVVPMSQQQHLSKLLMPVLSGKSDGTRGSLLFKGAGEREVPVVISIHKLVPMRERGQGHDPHIRDALSDLKPGVEIGVWAVSSAKGTPIPYDDKEVDETLHGPSSSTLKSMASSLRSRCRGTDAAVTAAGEQG